MNKPNNVLTITVDKKVPKYAKFPFLDTFNRKPNVGNHTKITDKVEKLFISIFNNRCVQLLPKFPFEIFLVVNKIPDFLIPHIFGYNVNFVYPQLK